MKKFVLLTAMVSLSVHAGLKEIPPSPFVKSKVIIKEEIRKLPDTEGLVILLDMNCVEERGLEELKKFPEFKIVDHSPKLRMNQKVFVLEHKEETTRSRLTQFANASQCIIGITNDVKYEINAFNDPRYSEQLQHTNIKTDDFYRKSPWIPTTSEDKAVIAVLDTGIDYNHSDLSRVMFRRNGTIVGANFVASASDYYDDHGHGTHVAGLAASEANNFLGGAGVCGLSCTLMPVKVLSKEGSGFLSDIANGVFWAVDNGADVLNMSLGRTINFAGMSPLELEAFRYAMTKNVVVAVAAGNDAAVLRMDGAQSWPAMFAELPGVVTVGSLDAGTGALSAFSNRSPKFVEIGAPGATTSTTTSSVGLLSTATGGGYVRMSGTSMATPIAAGAMGLIIGYHKKHNRSYSVWDVEKILKASSTSNPALTNFIEGGRVLDLSILADELLETPEETFRLDVSKADEKFINDLYYVILRRSYDVGGAQFHQGLMRNQRLPLEHLIMNTFLSAEYKTNFADITNPERVEFTLLKDHLIPDVFLTILGRLPTQSEADYWLEYLTVYRNKMRFFVRTLLRSKEFENRVAGSNLATYPRVEVKPSDVNSFCQSRTFVGNFTHLSQVDYAYCAILERTPDATGREFYASLLERGVTLETIMFEMFKSSEYIEFNDFNRTSDRIFVNILYYSLLHRLPLSHEAFFWIDALRRTTREVLIRNFLESNEFKAVLKNRSVRQ